MLGPDSSAACARPAFGQQMRVTTDELAARCKLTIYFERPNPLPTELFLSKCGDMYLVLFFDGTGVANKGSGSL